MNITMPRVLRAVTATAAAAALGVVGLVSAVPAGADTAPATGVSATVSADSLPTVQIENGVVWNQAVARGKVYAGGEFQQARPAGAAPGTSTVVRTNLLRYDIVTGVLDSWSPNPNAQIRAVTASPDGTRLYIGGDFTTVEGKTRSRIAAFDTATGQLLETFKPAANSQVRAIAATNTTVYVGGIFGSINPGGGSVPRTRLAAFRASDGALLPWAPTADNGSVSGLAVSPDGTRVAIGGNFTTFNGTAENGYGMALVDAVTGTKQPLPVNSIIRNGTSTATMSSVTGDADGFYMTGVKFGNPGGNFEGTFRARWDTGQLVWMEDCHGDTHSAWPGRDAVYTAGHAHYCGNVRGFPQTNPWSFYRGIAFSKKDTQKLLRDPMGTAYTNYQDRPAPSLLHWYPELNSGSYTGQTQGPWTVTGTDDYVLYAGEFTIVNNVRQQGLARFPRAGIVPNKQGPRLGGTEPFTLTAESYAAGTVRLAWGANYDRDNENLTYEVTRNGVRVTTLAGRSSVWNRPMMSFLDEGLTPDTSYTYRVKAVDPYGNSALSSQVSATVATAGQLSAYANRVLADGATTYWRLGESEGTAAEDAASLRDAPVTGTVTKAVEGAVNDGNTAYTFNGTDSLVRSAAADFAPHTFSVEAWIKTTTTTGGKIIGYGNQPTTASSSFDRHVYMDNTGRLHFGVNPGPTRTASTTTSYNDGKWHHVVATLQATGMALYVDGVKVASRNDATAGQYLLGYWRVGGDALSTSWPSQPSSRYFAGSIDEVAIYDRALDEQTIAAHNSLGRNGVAPNATPTAKFTATAAGLTASLDGRSSTDPEGPISSYSWTFGDGTTGTWETATRTYAAAGTYPVTLTVTDAAGARASTTQNVTVTAPAPANQAPTARFVSTVTGLTAAVDASQSSDPENSTLSYAWDFGDGTVASGRTASRTYAAGGTYTVSLTVTDAGGATGTTRAQVTVSAPQEPVTQFVALDSFDRTTTGAWGPADVGGNWVIASKATSFSVAGGAGLVRVDTAGSTRTATLSGVATSSADVTGSIAVDKLPTASGHSVEILGRAVDASSYRLRVKVLNTGVVRASMHSISGTDTTLQQVNVPDLTYVPGEQLRVRFQVDGTGTTALRAKIWRSSQPEPTSWLLSATSTTAALQGEGTLGLSFYTSSSTTDLPVTFSVRDLSAVRVEP